MRQAPACGRAGRWLRSAGPGLTAAAPRARIDPPGGVKSLTAVHPRAPVRGHADRWRHELAIIQQTLADVDELQVVAGDFNAPGIMGRSESSWRQDFGIARTPARTGPGQDSPGHRYLPCAWIMYWFPGPPPCPWLGPCECPAPTITVSWSTSSSHRKPDRQIGRAGGAMPGPGVSRRAWPPPGVAQVYQIRLTCFAGWPSFHAPGRGTSERVQPDETLRGLPGGRLASSALPDLPERPGCWIWAGSARWASVPGPEGLRGHRQESSSTPRLANRHRAGPDTPPRAHAARLLPLDSRTWQAGPAVPGRQPSLCRQMAELENRAGSLDWERSRPTGRLGLALEAPG